MRLFLLLLCAVFLGISQAQARDTDLYPYAHIANPRYEQMAQEALQRMPERFDFMKFRATYTNTRQYDPLAEDAVKQMNDYAFAMATEKDPEKIERAKLGYQFVITDHLANIGVVTQALSLARQDRMYGNPKFFAWMKKGLLDAVMNSREGKTLKDAYAIVTLPEETAMLARLGVKLLRSEPRHEGFVYYNMDEVEDRSGKTWTIFVNTSFPMKFLDKQKSLKEKEIRLPGR